MNWHVLEISKPGSSYTPHLYKCNCEATFYDYLQARNHVHDINDNIFRDAVITKLAVIVDLLKLQNHV